MGESVKDWAARLEEMRPQMDELAGVLRRYGRCFSVEPKSADVLPLAYRAQFGMDGATVFLSFVMGDRQTDSGVVITNMVTLPESERSKGHGSRAVESLIRWASDCEFNEVRATQVSSRDAARFWERNGFVQCEPPNLCNDFVRVLKEPTHA